MVRRHCQPPAALLLGITLLGLSLTQAACADEALNQRVLVVFDRKTRDSISVAQYYARARHIPESHLCPLSLPNPGARVIPLADYAKYVQKPVQRCLDKAGREQILYIVLAYIRPQSLEVANTVRYYSPDSFLADIWDTYAAKPFDPFPPHPHPYYADHRAKDNLFLPFVSLAAFRNGPNQPLPIYSVWRLDGASPDIARSLVDKALKAESTHGPLGQACIDERMDPLVHPDQGYRAGDWDLYRAAQFLTAAGYKVVEDNSDSEFGTPPSPNCPNAALYSGWYKLNHYNDAFTWNDGAIGFHLDSLSVNDPRAGENWAANALKKGITVTSGAVNEPYLPGLPRPSGVFHDLLAGATVGDAFLRNTRYIKWMIINLGDPLYTPFAGGKTPYPRR